MPPGTQEPSWSDVFKEYVKAGTAAMHTSMPAVVVTYNQVLQTATVQPVIRQRVDDVALDIERPDITPIPPLSNVPVVWPSGLTWAITGPLVPGDPVTLVFSERSTDEWRAGGITDNIAQDARRFDLADAVAIPGGRSVLGVLAPTAPKGPTTVDPVAVVISTSVPAGIKLGGNTATDFALKGTAFEIDLAIFLAALAGAVDPVVTGAAATFAATLPHQSIKVLIE